MSKFLEYLKVALRNIRGNLLRSILTCIIIALGIWALVGIQSSIAVLGDSVADLFSPFGTNQFTISNRAASFDSSEDVKPRPVISYNEAKQFKQNYNFPSKVSISLDYGGVLELRGNGEKTNPSYSISGVDENYLDLNDAEIETGRRFSLSEIESGQNVAIIPMTLKDLLFKGMKAKEVVGQRITAGGQRYRIIGILKDKGQGFGGTSNFILVPIENVNIHFATTRSNYGIKVGVSTSEGMEPGMAEATGIMRLARGLRVIDEDDFYIDNPAAADKQLQEMTQKVSVGGLAIGLVTLFGAAIGLMNILLVSVTERIREIGISKAIGATVESIRLQYFLEGIVISLFGGLLGIVLGIISGWLLANAFKREFIIPWKWIGIGLAICITVGLVSSIYPAIKASKLNPIDALRHN